MRSLRQICMNGIYKRCVYIGNPNQTRHLGNHHRRIAVLEQERPTLLNLLRGENVVTESPTILCNVDVSCHLCIYTLPGPGS